MKPVQAALLAACALIATGAGSGPPVVLHPLMKDIVAVRAQDLWDVGNKAMDDDGNPSVKALTAGDWDKLAKAAGAMKDAADAMVNASAVAVMPPGGKLPTDGTEGATTTGQIQGFIDKDPAGFAADAQKLSDVSATFLKAVQSRQAADLGEASAKLDEVCEACHQHFWYPPQ